MDNNNIIEINDLIKDFPIAGRSFRALKGITTVIKKKEFMGLVGPSGSGKTTLLNVIGGLDTPTEGTVSVMGKSLIRSFISIILLFSIPQSF